MTDRWGRTNLNWAKKSETDELEGDSLTLTGLVKKGDTPQTVY